MSELIDTTEMYLRIIAELQEEEIRPMRARIVERLEQSSPTVSQTVGRMERDGLLHLAGDRSLELTDLGRRAALKVVRRHRIAECLLAQVLQVSLDIVHEQACRWEHVFADEVEQRAFEVAGCPQFSPYGCPIPGVSGSTVLADDELARFGSNFFGGAAAFGANNSAEGKSGVSGAAGLMQLSEISQGEDSFGGVSPVKCRLRRISESVQHELSRQGRLLQVGKLLGQLALVELTVFEPGERSWRLTPLTSPQDKISSPAESDSAANCGGAASQGAAVLLGENLAAGIYVDCC